MKILLLLICFQFASDVFALKLSDFTNHLLVANKNTIESSSCSSSRLNILAGESRGAVSFLVHKQYFEMYNIYDMGNLKESFNLVPKVSIFRLGVPDKLGSFSIDQSMNNQFLQGGVQGGQVSETNFGQAVPEEIMNERYSIGQSLMGVSQLYGGLPFLNNKTQKMLDKYQEQWLIPFQPSKDIKLNINQQQIQINIDY